MHTIRDQSRCLVSGMCKGLDLVDPGFHVLITGIRTLARALEENVKKFAEEHAEKLVVNKTLDVMLKESPEKAPSLVKKLSAVMGNGVDTVTPAADDFDNWYKSQFKE